MKLYDDSDWPIFENGFDVHANMKDDGPSGDVSGRIHVCYDGNDGKDCDISVDKLVGLEHERPLKAWTVSPAAGRRFWHMLERFEKESDMIFSHADLGSLCEIVECLVFAACKAAENDDKVNGRTSKHLLATEVY